jgi:hypothetical protein
MASPVAESKDSELWGQCWKEEYCVRILGRRYCFTAAGCVRIILTNEGLMIEIEVSGRRIRYKLIDTCYDAFTVGIASIRVCAKPEVVGGHLKSLELDVELCIGTRVDRVNIRKCWTVFKKKIYFFAVSELLEGAKLTALFLESNLAADVESLGLAPGDLVGVEFDCDSITDEGVEVQKIAK